MSLVNLKASPQGSVSDAEAFILLGFGFSRNPDGSMSPGSSNIALAQELLRINPERRPTVTQHGTYLAIQELLPAEDIDSWVYNLPHFRRRYVDTRGALLAAHELLQAQQKLRVCVVTHPYQLARAAHIAAHIDYDEVIIPDLEDRPVPFDPDSLQPWTRNRFNYTFFEYCLARPIGLVFGWANTRPFA